MLASKEAALAPRFAAGIRVYARFRPYLFILSAGCAGEQGGGAGAALCHRRRRRRLAGLAAGGAGGGKRGAAGGAQRLLNPKLNIEETPAEPEPSATEALGAAIGGGGGGKLAPTRGWEPSGGAVRSAGWLPMNQSLLVFQQRQLAAGSVTPRAGQPLSSFPLHLWRCSSAHFPCPSALWYGDFPAISKLHSVCSQQPPAAPYSCSGLASSS